MTKFRGRFAAKLREYAPGCNQLKQHTIECLFHHHHYTEHRSSYPDHVDTDHFCRQHSLVGDGGMERRGATAAHRRCGRGETQGLFVFPQ